MSYLRLCAWLILLIVVQAGAHPKKALIFDLGNVLFEVSRFRFAHHVGIGNFLWYSIMDKKNPSALKDKVFEILHKTRNHQQVTIDIYNTPVIVVDDQGNPLPALLCDYQAGVKSSKEIFEEVLATVRQLDQQGYFTSIRERNLVEQTIKTLFDPEPFSTFIKPIRKAVNLLRKYSSERDEQGNPRYEIFVLSNWDPESFEIVKNAKHGKKILQYIKPENIIISGQFHDLRGLKPNPWVFAYTLNLIEQRGFHRSDCIFIDDQLVNIEAARFVGLRTILLQNGNFKQLEQELKEFIQPPNRTTPFPLKLGFLEDMVSFGRLGTIQLMGLGL